MSHDEWCGIHGYRAVEGCPGCVSGTYGKGRSFDELAEIAQARLKRIRELESALAEAIEWLDNDLAHAPDTVTAMADRDLIASWRAALDGWR